MKTLEEIMQEYRENHYRINFCAHNVRNARTPEEHKEQNKYLKSAMKDMIKFLEKETKL